MDRLYCLLENQIEKTYSLERPRAGTEFPHLGLTLVFSWPGDKVCISIIGKNARELTGPAHLPLCFHDCGRDFVLIPDKLSMSADWNPEIFPQNPKSKDYLKKVLNFLIKTMALEAGIILLRGTDGIKILENQGLRLTDKAEFFLKEFLAQENSLTQSVMKLGPETHSLFFKDPLLASGGLFAKTALGENEEVVLYVPDPGQLYTPGMLKVLLSLFSQGISAHLLWIRLELARQNKQGIETQSMFWGECGSMQNLRRLSDKLARTNLNLFLGGETGTGKEMLAQYLAQVAHAPHFVAINCASIPKELAESILFGHVKGAFTGAYQDLEGKFSQAHLGILFLDEVAELSLEVQAKLLRVLQDGKLCPLGGKEKEVKVRVFSATCQNLLQLVEKGKFRQDLYYRLAEASLELPPLRNRGANDIKAIAQFLLNKIAAANQMPIKVLSPEAEASIVGQSWPGNIRELFSSLRRGFFLADSSCIGLEDLHHLYGGHLNDHRQNEYDFPLNLNQAKDLLTRILVDRALAEAQNNKTEAARLLGVNLRTFFRIQSQHLVGHDMKNDSLVITQKLDH